MNCNLYFCYPAFRLLKGALEALILVLVFSAGARAQSELITNDDGCTWFYSQEPTLLNKVGSGSDLANLTAVEANYVKFFDFVDPEFPRYPYPVVFGNADHDGKIEMYRAIYVSENQAFTRVYEFDKDMNYTVSDLPFYGVPWDIGDIDGNGLTDLVVQSGDPELGVGYLRIYESPDEDSYPSELKAEVILPGRQIEYRARLTDTDGDGNGEVLLSANGFSENDMRIYEWQGSDLNLIWVAAEITSITLTKAIGDFDHDGRMEIAVVEWPGGQNPAHRAVVYENIGDDDYKLTQQWNLPDEAYWFTNALPEMNVDGEGPEFAVGLSYIRSQGGTQYQWRIYKAVSDDFMEEWYNTQFPQNVWVGVITHTTGDYDGDGFDEILVDDHPTLKILEYVDGQMQVTWTQTRPDPIWATSADMRMDGVANFVVVDFTSNADVMSFWEEERLADAYLNKSLDASSTWPNSARHILKGGGKLHEEFTSGGDIFYRRSSDNGTTWEMTKRISSGEGGYGSGCLAVAHSNSLHLVWQRQIASDRFQVWHSRSLDNGTSWSVPVILPNANNIQVGYWQAGGAMPVIAEMSTSMSTDGGESWEGDGGVLQYQLVVVYCSMQGLRYRTSTSNGATWTIPSPSDIISGLYNENVWYPSLASGGSFLSLTYDYRPTQQGMYSRIYNGSTWSTETHVADITGTVFNRHSSVAVDPEGHPISAWCAQKFINGQLDVDFRILFRYGNSNNTWNPWFVEFSKIQGVHSYYPSLTYYNKGGINPYGINIVHHTFNQSTSAQTVRLKKYDIGTTWIDTTFSTNGAWANVSLENSTSGVPKNMWTEQAGPPYQVSLSSQFLPKLLVEGEAGSVGRRVVVQHRQTGAFIAFELADMRVILSDSNEVPIEFRPHDFREPLDLTLANVWEYLGSEAIHLPQNARRLVFNKSVFTNLPVDTVGHSTPSSFPSRQFRFRVLDGNTGNILATLDTSSASGTVSVSVANFAGQHIIFRPNITLTGVPLAQLSIGVGDVIGVSGSGNQDGQSGPAKSVQAFGLGQNYPNPFNPLTTISYNVLEPGRVNLTVYDILGREVAVLVNEIKGEGSHSVTFDASRLPSGVYFYRLRAGLHTDVRKMIVTK